MLAPAVPTANASAAEIRALGPAADPRTAVRDKADVEMFQRGIVLNTFSFVLFCFVVCVVVADVSCFFRCLFTHLFAGFL